MELELYTKLSVEELVNKCLERGILVTPEQIRSKETLLSLLSEKRKRTVKIVKNYTKQARKRTVQDFVKHFRKRYEALSAILKTRGELQNATSISRLLEKKEREPVSFIGMVSDVKETKSKHKILTIEDSSGSIEVWIHAKNKELSEIGKEIVPDEVIGVVGQSANRRVFADQIIFPDIPIANVMKKGREEVYVVFVGDVEIGSKLFMKNEFENMILWLSGKVGNEEQREIAKKVGYVVFIGDLVHGAGVYPGQQEDSNIHDIKKQYEEFTKYVKMIPRHMQIVLIAGNHDAGRLQEPQLPIYKDFAEDLYALPNVNLLSNPSRFTIDQSENHPGFDIIVYHGYSLVYYANNLQLIKDKGGMEAMDEVMRLYLRKRHLAPTHGSNTYVPDPEEDPMIIDSPPDFLITGHVHNVSHGTYNGVTMINAGCWNDVSPEQEKRGLKPEPAKLPVVNLRTRELKIMNFRRGE